MKLELGGGSKPRDGFVQIANRDSHAGIAEKVDYLIDLESVGPRYLTCNKIPIDDDSVDEVYSAHCLEHVANLEGVLWELGRVCRHGATIEIHVPHWNSPEAMCPGHKHVITEQLVRNWCKQVYSGKQFVYLLSREIESESFDEAKEVFPLLTDDQVRRFIPGTCFQSEFVLGVRRMQ